MPGIGKRQGIGHRGREQEAGTDEQLEDNTAGRGGPGFRLCCSRCRDGDGRAGRGAGGVPGGSLRQAAAAVLSGHGDHLPEAGKVQSQTDFFSQPNDPDKPGRSMRPAVPGTVAFSNFPTEEQMESRPAW